MKNYSYQYKLLFCFTWSSIYLFFPTWHLPITINERFIFYIKLILYFSISAYLINIFLKDIPAYKPIIIKSKNWLQHIKNNVWLSVLCCIALVLQIYPLTFPVALINEPRYTTGPLWLYEVINNHWHNLLNIKYLHIRLDVPIQYASWFVTGLVILAVRTTSISNFKMANPFTKPAQYKIVNLSIYLFTVLIFLGYFLIYNHYFSWIHTSPDLLTDPPVSHIMYFTTYLFFGPTYIVPRIIQLIFYVLSAIYLYRIIILFIDNEAALLGATIYLFSPLVFSYAHLSELAPGIVFFILMISFYYLRFTKEGDNRDLLLTSFFIGLGFLYKRDILLMLFICIAYLIINKSRNRNAPLILPLKVLFLSLVAIIPWFYVPRYFEYFRVYEVAWSHFTSPDLLGEYFFMIPSQISWVIFFLFLLSIIYILFANQYHLSIFFGLIFTGYYIFYTGDVTTKWRAEIHRFSIVFYPTIAVFLSLLLSGIVRKIKWKHSFKLIFSILTIYLICLCAVPSFSKLLITYKDVETQQFPGDQAIKWIKDNVKDEEKVLVLSKVFALGLSRELNDDFELIRNRLVYAGNGKPPEMYSDPQKLKPFCNLNKISYIVFPNIMYSYHHPPYPEILNYLQENKKNEFTEVAKFNLKDNYIFIYKLNVNPINLKE